MKSNGVTQKDVLFLSISLFIVVVAWISFNIYHAWATSSVTPEVQEQLAPIDPTFDTNTIQQLKTRQGVEPLYQLPKVTPSVTEPVASVPANLDTLTITPEPIQTQDAGSLTGPTTRP